MFKILTLLNLFLVTFSAFSSFSISLSVFADVHLNDIDFLSKNWQQYNQNNCHFLVSFNFSKFDNFFWRKCTRNHNIVGYEIILLYFWVNKCHYTVWTPFIFMLAELLTLMWSEFCSKIWNINLCYDCIDVSKSKTIPLFHLLNAQEKLQQRIPLFWLYWPTKQRRAWRFL